MNKLLIAFVIIMLATRAMAVSITTPPPVGDVVRTVTIPAHHTTFYRKGELTFVDKPEQKICYDKNNRKVLCTEPATTPAKPAAPTNTPPPPKPVQTYPSGQSQYEMQDAPLRSQYEQ